MQLMERTSENHPRERAWRPRRGWAGSPALFLILLASWGWDAQLARAQALSPYSVFQAMSQGDMRTVQAKLTYVGASSKLLPSVAFVETTNATDLTAFVPFRRPGISYDNETVPPLTFKTTAAELEAVIDNAGTLSAVIQGGVADPPFLSFALHSTLSGGVAFEVILTSSDTEALFNQIRLALASNRAGTATVNSMGCAIGALEPGQPTDVSGTVRAKIGGLRLRRDTNTFVGTVQVTNQGTNAISGPVSVVFKLPTGIALKGTDGRTCAVTPAGRGYLNVPLPAGALSAGQTVEFAIELSNPDLEEIDASFQVLAGPGAR